MVSANKIEILRIAETVAQEKMIDKSIVISALEEAIEKAAKSNVDVIFLDLEDAVAPDEKEQARKNIIEGLNDIV